MRTNNRDIKGSADNIRSGSSTAPTAEKTCADIAMTETAEEIASMSMREGGENGEKNELLVCFVCTGNTCRSPMAAAWFNHIMQQRAGDGKNTEVPKLRAISAGLYPHEGDPISRGAVAALESAGVESTEENPWREHRAARISERIMEKCHAAVGISGSHTLALMTEFPQYAGKLMSMPCDISDPFGADDAEYIRCLSDIRAGIGVLFGV